MYIDIPCIVHIINNNEVDGNDVDKDDDVFCVYVPTADFVLLMCAAQQWKVFECEKIEEWMVLAGENTDDPDPMEGRLFNPAPNFINCR